MSWTEREVPSFSLVPGLGLARQPGTVLLPVTPLDITDPDTRGRHYENCWCKKLKRFLFFSILMTILNLSAPRLWLEPGQAISVSALQPGGWGRGWATSTPSMMTRHQPSGNLDLNLNFPTLWARTAPAMTSFSSYWFELPWDSKSRVSPVCFDSEFRL